MSGYIDSTLLPDEKIIYRTHRHWIVFGLPIVWTIGTLIISLIFGIFSWLTLVVFILMLGTWFVAAVDYFFTEIALTSKRVLIKAGWVARASSETDLKRIASLEVAQSFLGRMLNYGVVVVCDIGDLRTYFSRIEKPLEFRRAVQMELDKVKQ